MSINKEILEKIKQQVEDQEDEIQEISLDQTHFNKFNAEIVAEIGKQALPSLSRARNQSSGLVITLFSQTVLLTCLEKYKDSLLFLSLNDCALNSLENFPNLPKLIRLELTDNKLTGTDIAKLSTLKDLQSLSLGGNPIQNYKDLEPLAGLTQLVQLDLFGCPISEKADYREKIFSSFKNLQILDNQDAEGKEVEYDEEDEDEEDGGEGEGEEGEDDEDENGEDFDDDDDDDDEDEDEESNKKKKVKKN